MVLQHGPNQGLSFDFFLISGVGNAASHPFLKMKEIRSIISFMLFLLGMLVSSEFMILSTAYVSMWRVKL